MESHDSLQVFETQANRYEDWFERHDGAAVHEPVLAGHGQGGFIVVSGKKPAQTS
jgi:hypothetical protein